MKLQGKVAVITGAGSGIGRAIALLFAAEGARVVLGDRNVASARETAAVVSERGSEAWACGVDVGDPMAVADFFRALDERQWGVDILVNNAGIAEELGMLHEVTDEVWPSVVETHLAILNTHVNGTFYCTREALRRMSGRRAGTIINMGALAGLRGGPGVASYSAAKGAIHAFTKAVAHDVAGLGIRVNCIAPGFVETPLLSQFPEQLRWLVIQLTALGRFGNPEEIAAVALFLASEESSFIIGQVISPNGGLYF